MSRMIDALKEGGGRTYLPKVQRTIQSTDASTTLELTTEQSVIAKKQKTTIFLSPSPTQPMLMKKDGSLSSARDRSKGRKLLFHNLPSVVNQRHPENHYGLLSAKATCYKIPKKSERAKPSQSKQISRMSPDGIKKA